jgi:hypothetical protein
MTDTYSLRVWKRSKYKPLFSLQYSLCADNGRRYRISENDVQVNTCGMGEHMRPKVTEVKIVLHMSHKRLTTTEEYIK